MSRGGRGEGRGGGPACVRAFSLIVSTRSCSGWIRARLCGSALPTTCGTHERCKGNCFRTPCTDTHTLSETHTLRDTHTDSLSETHTHTHTRRTTSWTHRGNDFIIPHHPKAAMPASALAVFVCDSPSRAEQAARGHPHRVGWAACVHLHACVCAVYISIQLVCAGYTSIQLVHGMCKPCGRPVDTYMKPSYSQCRKPGRRCFNLQGCHSHGKMGHLL